MSKFQLAVGLAAMLAFAAVGCSGGVDAAPLDPLAGSSPAALARQNGRQPVNNVGDDGDDSTAHPAKTITRGPREKHEKHPKGG